MDQIELIEKVLPVVNALRLYHRHEVVGLENIPEEGPILLVLNHSLATYDITLLLAAIYENFDRIPVPLIDRLFFKIPGLGELMEAMGARQGSPGNAEKVLREGGLVCVAPGGMREALRPSTERYQLRWDRRMGFAKLAMQAGAPVILAACPKADDLYDVFPNWLTSYFYKNYRLPVFLARGVGLSPIPRPIKLVHFLSKPIKPPPLSDDPEKFEAALVKFHRTLVSKMEDLMSQGIFYKGK